MKSYVIQHFEGRQPVVEEEVVEEEEVAVEVVVVVVVVVVMVKFTFDEYAASIQSRFSCRSPM